METGRQYTAGDVAALTGMTVRTLQHYDNIGLLPAAGRKNGRRYYTDDDILKLEQIQFYKLLGFPLGQIKEKLANKPTKKELSKIFEEHIFAAHTKIEQFHTVLSSLNASLTALSLGKYPPPGLMTDLIKSLNEACFVEWSPALFSEKDIKMFERFYDNVDEAFSLYHTWKALSIEAAMLAELEIPTESEVAQKLASRFLEMIMDATRGEAGQFDAFVKFNEKQGEWATGEAKLAQASEEYMGQALGKYIELNGIEIPDFLKQDITSQNKNEEDGK